MKKTILFVVLLTFPYLVGFQSAEAGGVLDTVLKVITSFATLAGVSSLVAALVSIGKYLGVVKDGSSSKWTNWLNLLAFAALVYFQVFRPDLTLDFLDGAAEKVTTVALFVLGFLTQMTVSRQAYGRFKEARVPWLGFSHSK